MMNLFAVIILFFASSVQALTIDYQPVAFAPTDVEIHDLLAYIKLDEGSGTSAADSASNHTGTLVNTPSWIAGVSGTGVNFTASSSQRISLANGPIIGNSSIYTINFWLITNNTVLGMPYGEGKSGTNTQKIFVDVNDTLTGDIGFGDIDDSAVDGFFTTPAVGSTDGNPHMITCVAYSKTNRAIFMDGVFRAGISKTVGTTTLDSPNIGTLQGTTFFDYLTGEVDQLRIYSVALSTDQIVNIYRNRK